MSEKDKAKRKRATDRMAKSELKKRLLSYSAVAGAALVGASHADAGIVYSGLYDITVDSGNSLTIDFDGGGAHVLIQHGSVSATTWGDSSSWGGPWASGLGAGEAAAGLTVSILATSSSGLAANLNGSQSIGPNPAGSHYWKTGGWQTGGAVLAVATGYWTYYTSTSSTTSSTSSSFGNFLGAKGCIGVRFDSGGGLKYGWIDFEGLAVDEGRITGWAYETSGDGIHCGATSGGDVAIPEPGGLVLLATGAAGLMAFRKKRTV